MTFDDIGRVLALALRDDQFRKNLINDPGSALKHESFGVGPKGAEFFRSLKKSNFIKAADDLHTNLHKDNLGLAQDMEV
jgi:hypothetical protein